MYKDEFKKLGFAVEEIDVYLAMLEIGGGFVSSIARKAGAHRVTTYNTLDNLEKKGFIRKTKKRGVQFYYPVNPKFILNQFEENYQTAKTLIPVLINMQGSHEFKPKIQFFEGIEQISEVFADLLKSTTEVIGYTNFKVGTELYPEYLRQYNKEVIKGEKKHRILCPNDEFHEKYIKETLQDRINKGLLEVFAVNPTQFVFKNALYVYDDKVVTISFDREEMMSVIIESKSNAETNRAIFNLAWLGATSFVAR